jgi:PleD family two-component response regulator
LCWRAPPDKEHALRSAYRRRRDMIRVLIVDDHEVVRQGLRYMLEQRVVPLSDALEES